MLHDRWLAEVERSFSATGRRLGATRRAVIELLALQGRGLLSRQEIVEHLRPSRAGSTSSVYRIVDELVALGLVERLDSHDGVARYRVVDSDHRHHHVVDDVTGEVSAFVDNDLEHAIAEVARRLKLELTSHDVILRGNWRSGG